MGTVCSRTVSMWQVKCVCVCVNSVVFFTCDRFNSSTANFEHAEGFTQRHDGHRVSPAAVRVVRGRGQLVHRFQCCSKACNGQIGSHADLFLCVCVCVFVLCPLATGPSRLRL